jgi:hypothetical protein
LDSICFINYFLQHGFVQSFGHAFLGQLFGSFALGHEFGSFLHSFCSAQLALSFVHVAASLAAPDFSADAEQVDLPFEQPSPANERVETINAAATANTNNKPNLLFIKHSFLKNNKVSDLIHCTHIW